MPEHRFQMAELGFQTPEVPFQTPEHRFQMRKVPFQTPELPLQMPELPFQMPELGFQMPEFRFQNSSGKFLPPPSISQSVSHSYCTLFLFVNIIQFCLVSIFIIFKFDLPCTNLRFTRFIIINIYH